MSNSQSQTQSAGIGFTGLLALVFITLKLTGVINWSWVWVLAPIWISAIFFIMAVVVLIVLYVLKD